MKAISKTGLHLEPYRQLCCAMGLMLWSASSVAMAAVDEHKVACTASQAAIANQAMADAKSALSAASRSFTVNTPVDKQIKWFGALNSSSADAVKKVYDAATGAATFTVFWCPVRNDLEFKWDVGDLAAVHPSVPGAIFLTPDFFKLQTTGSDSQRGTIIHELTHIVGIGLRPEVYGSALTKVLAATDPVKSRRNSDNYQYYIEDLIFGLK
ncbi:M35 family metallo-endopeptidase [Undibacterium sp. Ji83W]|uniref:M35 family metallo-endopeptidase n=1 Tax=Undibacterium sp. Ji83W TaxID=3413043 RepID=UPI003BF0EEC4